MPRRGRSRLQPRSSVGSFITQASFTFEEGEDNFIDEIFQDRVSITDELSLTWQFNPSLSDNITLNESINKTIEISLADQVQIHDEAVLNTIKNWVLFNDSVSKTVTLNISDDVTVSDNLDFTAYANFTDAVSMADSVVPSILS